MIPRCLITFLSILYHVILTNDKYIYANRNAIPNIHFTLSHLKGYILNLFIWISIIVS